MLPVPRVEVRSQCPGPFINSRLCSPSEILWGVFWADNMCKVQGRCSPFLEGPRAPAGCVVREYVHAPGGIKGACWWAFFHGSEASRLCLPLHVLLWPSQLWATGVPVGSSTLGVGCSVLKARATWAPERKHGFRRVGCLTGAWSLQPQVAKPSWSIPDSGQF